MGISHRDLLALSRKLTQRDTEAEWRAACSHAYYAGFHVCRSALLILPIEPPRVRGSHNKIIKAFKDCKASSLGGEEIQRVQSIGILLDQLRSLRAKSDYELEADIYKEDAVRAVRIAIELISELAEVLVQLGIAAPTRLN